MKRTRSNLVFLAVGTIVGIGVGYIIASDKKEQWLNEANNLVGKIKNAVSKCKNHDEDTEDINEDAED